MVWSKKYPIEITLKEIRSKHYKLFKTTKKIRQEAFQLELPEEWAI